MDSPMESRTVGMAPYLLAEHGVRGQSPDFRKLDVQVVEEEGMFQSLQSDWNELAELCGGTVYQTFEWAWIWWKHYGAPNHSRRLYILTFRDDGRLLAIAPLCITESSFLGVHRHHLLSFLGSGEAYSRSGGIFRDEGPSDYLNFISLAGHETSVARAFIHHLQSGPPFIRRTGLDLVNIPEGSPLVSRILEIMDEQKIRYSKSIADVCPQFPTPSSIEEWFARLQPSVRRRFQQARKASGSLFSVDSLRTEEQIRPALLELIRLHQSRWNRLGYPGLFYTTESHNFQEEVIATFFSKGWVSFKVAQVQGSTVAARLAFTYNGRLYDYLSGFDETSVAARRRPGLALLISMIEDAIRSGITTIDLLRGDEPYKFELNVRPLHNMNITVRQVDAGNASARLIAWLHRAAQLFLFVFLRECQLLQIQYSQHSLTSFAFHYIRFRTVRFWQKANASTRSAGPRV